MGIDLGIARFATFSDGTYLEPRNSFKTQAAKLAKYQRRMAHKQKFSNNWKKAKAKVQKVHTQIANARRDFLHKATNTISKNHAVVFVEDLQVRNMSKSAVGTAENPGKNVAQKSGLNKAILDQGWGELRQQLDYKLAWKGGMLFAMPPHHTSQTCPCCGHVSSDNRKTQARFVCVGCGYENNADIVGAINVLERGHRLLACGDGVLSPSDEARTHRRGEALWPGSRRNPLPRHKYLHNFFQKLLGGLFQTVQLLLGVGFHDFQHGEENPQTRQQSRMGKGDFMAHLSSA